ncbi:restriction endonuclease subunit S [Paenibacillus sp. IITD108]|uniref:restriction endonuclease subunit S n=1 Tax=Paenibacillus sp. IITD108 TaxID=3116649 RepID=UPI002F4089B3
MTLLEAATVSEDDFPYDLPEKWVWVELGNIAKFINGDRGNNYPSQKDFIKSGIPFINAGHLKNGKIDIAKMNYISKEKFEALGSGKVMEDDVLYCLRGTLGKAAIVSNIDEGAIASSLVILRPHKGIVSKYIYYYLISSIGMSMINIHDNGSAQPNLSAGNVKKYLVPIPSYYEQRRIVSRLEATFNRIDNARRIIGDLKEFEILKHSALYKAFRGELFDLVFND